MKNRWALLQRIIAILLTLLIVVLSSYHFYTSYTNDHKSYDLLKRYQTPAFLSA